MLEDFLKEFKNFIMRGNVLELAVGVVMGSAFTAIVNALVDHIIMPIVVALTGNASIEELSVSIGAATLNYGLFLQAIVDFLIIAFILFLVIRVANRFTHHEKDDEAEEELDLSEEYLRDIRDLLREDKNNAETYRYDRTEP